MSAIGDVMVELLRARAQHPIPLRSPHEGYAVLEEELLELRQEVFWGEKALAREEAVQVAAMALRFIEDVFDADPHAQSLEQVARELWEHRFDEVTLPPDLASALGAALGVRS